MKSISPKTAFCAIAASSGCAFLAGRIASIYYINPAHRDAKNAVTEPRFSSDSSSSHVTEGKLPRPYLLDGKNVPPIFYSGVVFDKFSSVLNSLYLEGENIQSEEVCTHIDNGKVKCSIDGTNRVQAQQPVEHDVSKDSNVTESPHHPAGQHLIVDIKNVDKDFLDDEVRLAKAMVGVANESQLTLLSYHCHKLIPMGVSCVGVLLESHVSFHTWPESGVITLDLFTCGEGKLVPVMPIIKKLFAIPQEKKDNSNEIFEEPHVVWTHKLRGFRFDNVTTYLDNDLGEVILESTYFDMKEEIAEAQTIFQRIDVYDTIDSRYADIKDYYKSLSNDGSYQASHPGLFLPQRTVFLDGVLQSTRKGLEAYHEALVQPVMFSHPNPKRVAIIGGGEGATLREVLKHTSVEKVKMIEIDEEMVMVSKEHLPEWNNCTDYIGSTDWCGDDSRAEVYYEDALAWFNNRFSQFKIDSEEYKEEPFDVLIMDALDPQDDIPFAEILYTDEDFIEALYNSLTDDGVIVLQLGVSPFGDDPSDEDTASRRRKILVDLLVKVGFESMHFYEDGNCGFGDPWTFLIAMKDKEQDELWYQTETELEIAIHDRIIRTHSGAPALGYFDGATLKSYRYPHKGFEAVYCREHETPENCNVDYTKKKDVPISSFEVRMSSVGDGSGRGIFASVDIEKDSTIARKEVSLPVVVNPATVNTVFNFMHESDGIYNIWQYFDGYGWQTSTLGPNTFLVDSSILTFVNHGCNGTYNTEDEEMARYYGPETITEQDATPADIHERRDVHNLFADRHLIQHDAQVSVALRNIKAGEEILCNYLHFTELEEEWYDEVLTLRRICNGEEVGLITQSENEHQEEELGLPAQFSQIQTNESVSDAGAGVECSTCDEL